MQSARGVLLQKVSAGDKNPPLKDLFVPRRLRGVGHLRHGYKGCRLALRQFLLEIFLKSWGLGKRNHIMLIYSYEKCEQDHRAGYACQWASLRYCAASAIIK